jgi:hypothetical protein
MASSLDGLITLSRIFLALLTARSCTGIDFRVVDSPHGWRMVPEMPHGGLKVNDTLGE